MMPAKTGGGNEKLNKLYLAKHKNVSEEIKET
jgi:hypothetical protein